MTVSHAAQIEESYAFIVDSLCTASREFYDTLILLREMGRRADTGDKAAVEILDVVYRFERLLRLQLDRYEDIQ